MLSQRITLSLKKTSKIRYVHIPATGEVWIWHLYRNRWFRWTGIWYKLLPENENFILYNFDQHVPNPVWDDIQRQRELLVDSGV